MTVEQLGKARSKPKTLFSFGDEYLEMKAKRIAIAISERIESKQREERRIIKNFLSLLFSK